MTIHLTICCEKCKHENKINVTPHHPDIQIGAIYKDAAGIERLNYTVVEHLYAPILDWDDESKKGSI
jgi:hypothetical protein